MDAAARLAQAKANPQGLRVADAIALAEAFGWVVARQRGSHVMLKRPGTMTMLNLQADKNGMAKRYQVLQIIRAIESAGEK